MRQTPELDFPDFPKIEAEYIDEAAVEIPLDSFLDLAAFKVEYEALREYYEKVKELK